MEHIACAYGFGEAWDGEYKLIQQDHWSNADGSYWIYHDPWFWYISDSQYRHNREHVKATKPYGRGVGGASWIDGPYSGCNGNPSGYVKLGTC